MISVNREKRLQFRHEVEDVEKLVDQQVEQWVENAGLPKEELGEKRFDAKVEVMRELMPEIYKQVE